MTVYEIDCAILDLVDEETGEVKDFEAFEQLQMERGKKIDNIGCWIKDLHAEVNAIGEEMKALKKRAEQSQKKADSLTGYLERILNGSTWKSPRLSVSYRASKATVVTDEDALRTAHPELMRRTETWKPDLTAIKEFINENGEVPFAHIEERTKLEIK